MVKHDSKLATEIRRFVHLAIDLESVADELDTIIGNLKEQVKKYQKRRARRYEAMIERMLDNNLVTDREQARQDIAWLRSGVGKGTLLDDDARLDEMEADYGLNDD